LRKRTFGETLFSLIILKGKKNINEINIMVLKAPKIRVETKYLQIVIYRSYLYSLPRIEKKVVF
jgi:hypothetical protein